MSFKNILITTDFSDNAAAAIPYAADLARKFGGTLMLLHVIEEVNYFASVASAEGVYIDTTNWMTRIEEDREKRIASLANDISMRENLPVNRAVLYGHAATQVADYAKKNHIDCIVLSTHGRSGLSHMFFGSVAEHIIRLSPCPVLTVRPKMEEKKAA